MPGSLNAEITYWEETPEKIRSPTARASHDALDAAVHLKNRIAK